MMNEKPTLKSLLESSRGAKLLFLGQEGIFSAEERERYLKQYGLTAVDTMQDGVVGVIEHHRLNPVEEDISYEAYAQKIPAYKLTEFEQLLSEEIDDDALLMAIKLGNDQERLLRLLGNEHLSDALFVRLLKLYRFNEEDEDNRQDRDVIMHTLRRYIDIKPNEEDLLYSYLTLRRLATEATDAGLLEALMGFPDFEFLVRGKSKTTFKETIARNEHITDELVRKLLSLRRKGVDRALAGNPSISREVMKHLFDKHDPETDKALAVNRALDEMLFDALLERGEEAVSLLLLHQPIDKDRFKQVLERKNDDYLLLVASNENISEEVIALLMERLNVPLSAALASNRSLMPNQLEVLYNRGEESSMAALAANPSTPLKILETLYAENSDDMTILAALAHNPSVPEKILRELFERDDLQINRGLATNASLPMDLLDILKVDTRLQNELAQNENLAKSYEEVLNQNKAMMNL